MRAVTTIEKATNVLIEWLKECDIDSFVAVFDYAFGTKSECNPENEEEFIIESGNENEYGGIIEDKFKEDMKHL